MLWLMRRAELEALPRTTEIFGPRRDGPPPGAPAARAVRRGFYPPLPLARESRELPEAFRTVLWGWDVLRVLSRQGVEEVATRSFEGTAVEAVELILTLEDRAGEYSLEEQSRIVSLCEAGGIEPGDSINRLVTGGRPFSEQARRFAALPVELKRPVSVGTVDLKTAERWSEFPQAARAVVDRTEGLTFSNRRRLFTMLWEIAQRDGLSDAALAARAESLLASVDPLAEVHHLRYPRLSSLQETFEEITKRSLSGSGVRLSPPPYFEGSRFTVEFSFRSGEELTRRISALSRLEDETDELFELL